MEGLILASIFAAVAFEVAGAPAFLNDGEQPLFGDQQQFDEFLREAPSQYATQYLSPCAAAAASSVHMPVYASPYQHHIPKYQGYAAPHYGYASPHYRSVEEQINDAERLRYSDMDFLQTEHMPMARMWDYDTHPAAAGLSAAGGQVLSQSGSGPAIGLFPNAKVGGCNVPLLFSCTPTIVSGRMLESQAPSGPVAAAVATAAAANSYRLVDDAAHHDPKDHHDDFLTHEQPTHLSPVKETSHNTQS